MKRKDKRLKKSGLTKEQLDCLDKHVKEEFLRRFWSNGPDHLFPATWMGNWNETIPKAVYSYPELHKLIKKFNLEDNNDID